MILQERNFVCDGETYPHYYLCNYKPYREGVDKLSYSLIRFKKGARIDIQAWTACSVEGLGSIAIPSNPVTLRALHSHETKVTKASNTSLDSLARVIAASTHGRYMPQLLQKRVHVPLKGLDLEERIQVIDNLYTFVPRGVIHSLILVDDIFTSGSTMTAMIRSIRKKLSCPMVLFTLAATDRASNAGASLSAAGYSWTSHQGWIQAHEPVALYSSIEDLKHLIETDFR